MDFGLSPKEGRFREELREFLEREEIAKKAGEEWDSGLRLGRYSADLRRKLGERGWICPHWPKEYGGLGLPRVYQYIVDEELSYFYISGNTVNTRIAGSMILRYGSKEQKRKYLPRIAKGELVFALGYTEPQAGCDLASIEMRAEDKGTYFLLNGQKMFCSACHFAEYQWVMARTEVTTPKYRGLSHFIVDLKAPGITIKPIWVLGGRKGAGLRTNEVFYDDVRVPKEYMVAEKNQAFYMLTEALAYERMSPAAGFGARRFERMLNELVEYVKGTGKGKDPTIRQSLAELRVDLEVFKLLGKKVCWMIEQKAAPYVEAALAKTLMCQLMEKLSNLGFDILGPYGLLRKDSKWAVANGEVEWRYRDFLVHRITLGTPEIMWNVVAVTGLGLPGEPGEIITPWSPLQEDRKGRSYGI